MPGVSKVKPQVPPISAIESAAKAHPVSQHDKGEASVFSPLLKQSLESHHPISMLDAIHLESQAEYQPTDLNQLHMLKKLNLTPENYDFSELKEYAQLSNYPYCKEESELPENWQVQSSQDLFSDFLISNPEFELHSDGMISTSSGLFCYVIKKSLNGHDKYVISFGGTTSGKAAGSFLERSIENAGSTLKQWLANAKNAILGRTPTAYKQAVTLTEYLSQIYPNDVVETTGHSLGGGIASYAAAMVGTPEKPMAARGFCSAELGSRMQQRILDRVNRDPQAFSSLVSGIRHIKIKGDPVPNMHRIFNVQNIGTSLTIDLGLTEQPNLLQRHIGFAKHICRWADEQLSESTEETITRL